MMMTCSVLFRLTPSYMFVILFYSNLYAFLGEGPLWYGSQVRTPCDSYWWTNLLYINNFHPFSLLKEVGHCFCLFVFLYRFFIPFLWFISIYVHVSLDTSEESGISIGSFPTERNGNYFVFICIKSIVAREHFECRYMTRNCQITAAP